MSATLSGHVTPQGSGTGNAVIKLFVPVTHAEVANGKYIRAIDATGNFTITVIPPGTYDVGVKLGGYLSTLATSQVFTEGNTTTIDFGSQLGGDSSGDDRVTLVDYNMTLANNGKSGTCYGYPGNWLMPDWPTAAGGRGASYELIGGQHV